jgi:hypothetical protein
LDFLYFRWNNEDLNVAYVAIDPLLASFEGGMTLLNSLLDGYAIKGLLDIIFAANQVARDHQIASRIVLFLMTL